MGELGLDSPQQPHLGRHLLGKVAEGDGVVAGAEVEGIVRGHQPLPGPGLILVVVRRSGDQPAE